jgi:hypothetical protein
MTLSPRARRILRTTAAIGVGLTILVAVMAFVLWRQLTALPAWYDDEAALAAAPADEDWITADPPSPLADPGAEELLDGVAMDPEGRPSPGAAGAETGQGGHEPPSPRRASGASPTMRNFHLRSAVRNESLRKATKASRAEFIDGELRAGVVLEPGLIDRDTLDPATRRTVDRALRAFPGAKSRRVYVGLVDTPRTVDGILQLGADTRLRVGDVELDFDVAMRRVGLSPARVRAQIDAELRRLKVRDPRNQGPAAVD